MGYCKDVNGMSLPDSVVKELILKSDLKTACLAMSMYVTKRIVKPLHIKILHNICSHRQTIDLAPRGFGKSTVGDVDYCLTRIIRDPDIRIMIGSKTQSQSDAFLKEIRSHLELNEDLIRVFGEQKGDLWNDAEFTVKSRTVIKKEATVTALGASGAVVSKHFDLIIGDDLVGFENARTNTQREKLREWFYSSLYPTLEPHGEIHILGTRYSPLDLYQLLIESKNYVVQVQQAIRTKGKMKGQSLWEDKFSLEQIESIKKEAGLIIFNMQYQNDVELAKGSIFKASYFKYHGGYYTEGGECYVRKPNPMGGAEIKKVRVYFGVDLAIKLKETNDYYCLMVIGIDDEHNVYVLRYIKERLSFRKQVNSIYTMHNIFPMVMRIGVEAIGYQEALAQEIRDGSLLPVISIESKKDKVTQAMKRSPLFENGKVYFGDNMQDMEECFLLFPDVEHDDLFDAFDTALASTEQKKAKVLDRKLFNI